jgi:hypothetical protein
LRERGRGRGGNNAKKLQEVELALEETEEE